MNALELLSSSSTARAALGLLALLVVFSLGVQVGMPSNDREASAQEAEAALDAARKILEG